MIKTLFFFFLFFFHGWIFGAVLPHHKQQCHHQHDEDGRNKHRIAHFEAVGGRQVESFRSATESSICKNRVAIIRFDNAVDFPHLSLNEGVQALAEIVESHGPKGGEGLGLPPI